MKRRVIYVVDDDPDVRESICDILRYGGYEACGFEDGAEALTLRRAGSTSLPMHGDQCQVVGRDSDRIEDAQVRQLAAGRMPD
jgi:CheY-like chemotaxis protein